MSACRWPDRAGSGSEQRSEARFPLTVAVGSVRSSTEDNHDHRALGGERWPTVWGWVRLGHGSTGPAQAPCLAAAACRAAVNDSGGCAQTGDHSSVRSNAGGDNLRRLLAGQRFTTPGRARAQTGDHSSVRLNAGGDNLRAVGYERRSLDRSTALFKDVD